MKTLSYLTFTSIILAFLLVIAGNCNQQKGTLVQNSEHGFQAVFPGPVAKQKGTIETSAGEAPVHHFLHVRWDEQYELSISELPRETREVGHVQDMAALNHTKDHLLRRYRGSLESEREIRSQGVKGMDFTVRTGGGGLVRTRLFQRNGKLYITTARVRGGEETEARAHRFVESMKLL